MARRIKRFEAQAFDTDPVAIGDADGDHVGLGLLAHHRDAARALAQRVEPGDVVGMEMRVDRLHQPEIELLEQLDIAVDPLQHGIDDERLASMAAGEKIAIGARS